MKIKLDDLPAAIKKLNPGLFGPAIQVTVTKPALARPLDRGQHVGKGGTLRVVVCLIRKSRRLLDDDNLAGGFKHLRDAIARSLGRDDGDRNILWDYGCVRTRGREETLVVIELAPAPRKKKGTP